TLQMDNGFRYHFEKLTDNSGATYYRLLDIHDSHQNQYILTYNGQKNLKRVTEPAGRFIDITYGTIEGKKEITEVTTQDGRTVSYSTDVITDASLSTWVELTDVTYGDGTHATYKYSQTIAGTRPHLDQAKDPRYPGPAVDMEYTYDSSSV